MGARLGRAGLAIAIVVAVGAFALPVASASTQQAKPQGLKFKLVTDQGEHGEIIVFHDHRDGHKRTFVLFDADDIMDCSNSDTGGSIENAHVADSDHVRGGADNFDMVNHVNVSGTHTVARGATTVFGKFGPKRNGQRLSWTHAHGRLKQTAKYITNDPFSETDCSTGIVHWHTTSVKPYKP